MFEVKKVEVLPKRDKFGIEHRLYIEGKTDRLRELFEKYASADHFLAEGDRIELAFEPREVFQFKLEKPIEDYYDEEIHSVWKEMVASAMGMEEPFRYYSFYTTDGEHIGTIGFKQDCENFQPVILVYKNF